MKRSRANWTDDQRAEIQAAIDETVPADQTGILRDDAVAGVREVIRRRRENTRLGKILLNALHEDSGSWPAVAYMTGLTRMQASRWGDKVIEDDDC